MSKILLIGIGNEFRQDDGIGIHIARKIKMMNLPNVEIHEASGEGSELIEKWKGKSSVIIVDAVNSGNVPGEIYFFNTVTESLPTKFFNYSSHAFGLAEAIEVSRRLQQLPSELFVYGIEGKYFEFGEEISEEVQSSSDSLIKVILTQIEKAIQNKS
ncbi:MAG: hydrogenase maturation protease [Bacteroidetes bacterium]|nr:hydrogenase maturation protease [Bacteroidota bacterium]MBU2586371.1 hydrogenase maturation protease [Bacteroidota bacterium]